MKKYIVNILIFFAIIVTIDIGVSYVGDYLQTHSKGGDSKMMYDLMKKDTHDILILGSSRAHTHYNTPLISEKLGYDVYNAGYNGNGVILSVGILETILERYTPKMVVFDVEPIYDIEINKADDNNKRYLNRLKPYYKEKCIGRLFWDISLEEWMKVHVGMIRYNSVLPTIAIENIITLGSDNQGYQPNDGKMEEDRDIVWKENDVDEFKLKYFRKLIDLCKNNNVVVVVVASPKYGTKDSTGLIPVIDICRDMHVPFVNYYAKPLSNNKDFFKEPLHLNANGANFFTNLIIGDMANYLERRECKNNNN